MTHTWLVPNSELTAEQRREVQVDALRHRVFFGEPGAGCTQALLHRARRLLDATASPDRLRVLLPGEGLTSFLRPELSLLGLPQECVTTLDAWRKDWFGSRLRQAGVKPDAEAVRRAARDWAAAPGGEPLLDFALVDNAEELDQEDYDFLRAAALHVTVAVGRTPYASVGDRAAGVAAALGLAEPAEALLGMRRGTPHLGQVAAAFLGDPRDRAEFLRHAPLSGARETPLVYGAESVRDEDDRLAAIVRTRHARGERVAVFVPTRRHVFTVQNALRARGVETQGPQGIDRWLDFSGGRPMVMSYDLTTGLTFDAVCMPRLTPAAFMRAGHEAHLLFTGITRAARWAYLSFVRKELPALEALRPLVEQGVVVRKDWRGRSAPPAASRGLVPVRPGVRTMSC